MIHLHVSIYENYVHNHETTKSQKKKEAKLKKKKLKKQT